MKDIFDVTNKVVFITGSSRGLGKAMAEGFAARGAKVVISSRKPEACQQVVDDIVAAGGDAIAVPCHVGDWDGLEPAIDAAIDHYGRLDVLVNNAGMSPIAPSLLETSEALFDKIIAINLKGPTRLSAVAADRMKATGGGCIINISSIGALRPDPLTTTYSAAKAGLNVLTQACAQEFAPWNIRVNAIVCGVFRTDITKQLLANPDMVPRVTGNIALGRPGEPEDIVGTALYLASSASSFTTGECIVVDGGVQP